MITVGQIVKPQGVRGEVKVKPMTNDPSRFCVLKSVYVGGQPYKIAGVRVSGGDVYLRFVGVNDRNAAEALRGTFLTIDRAAAVPLEDGEFFIDDLEGAFLVARTEDGGAAQTVGVIRSVQSFGAADVITVDNNGTEYSFPFVKALRAEFDVAGKTLAVDADILKQVAVYDED